MSGAQALGYSRVRVDGDLKRIERQQLVIQAVADRSVGLGLVSKLPETWDAYRHAIRTDIDTAQIPGFALLAKQMDLSRIESGQHPSKPDTLRRLAHALELRFVMGFESGPPEKPVRQLIAV